MISLIVIGWLALVVVALFFTVQGLGLGYLCLGFSGKLEWPIIIPLIFAAIAWYSVYITFPFEITMQVAK